MATKTVQTYEPSILQNLVNLFNQGKDEDDQLHEKTGWRDIKRALEKNPEMHKVFIRAKAANLGTVMFAHSESIKTFLGTVVKGSQSPAKPSKDAKRALLKFCQENRDNLSEMGMDTSTLFYVLAANLKQGPEKSKPEPIKPDKRASSPKIKNAVNQ